MTSSPLPRPIRVAIVLTVVLASAGASAGAEAQASTASAAVPGQLLVRFDAGTPLSLKDAAHAAAGARLVRRIALGYELVSVADHAVPAAVTAYRAQPAVSVVEPNFRGRIALSPSDACHAEPCEGFTGQWHHRMTNTPFGWDVLPGRTLTAVDKASTQRITIAVLDTKIDVSHPDWVNRGGSSPEASAGGQLDLTNARDWVPSSKWSGSAAYHGTFVAGLAAAATGNGRAAAGVGYSATILPLTVVDGAGNTDAASLADAIVYAWQRGARIINLSLGILGDSQAVHDAIVTVTRGSLTTPPSLVVAAAGNNTGNAAFYPGSYAEVMSVSGTNANDERAACSNYNSNVSVSAPADKLVGMTVMPTERVQAPCGTSAAAPQVSGLAALLLTQDASRTPAQLRQIIERSADDLGASGRDDHFGHGRVNAERALRTSGPSVTRLRATVVGRGGSSTISASAASSAGIQRAELIFGRPDAAPIAMTAADGSFGGSGESLTASLSLPAGIAAGAHTVWVRAHDGSQWGATAVGVVIVDGRAPTISSVSATNAVRAANQPVTLSFSVADDHSTAFTYGVEFRSTTTGALVHRDVVSGAKAGAQSYRWMPSINVPGGPFKVKIGVADASGNAATTETGTVVT